MLGTGQEIVSATLARKLGLYTGKLDRHVEAADAVLGGLTHAGYQVRLADDGAPCHAFHATICRA